MIGGAVSAPAIADAPVRPAAAESQAPRTVEFESGDPQTYHAIIAGGDYPRVTLRGYLFEPSGSRPYPVVIVAPGSGGIGPGAKAQAEAFTVAGLGALLVDSFGPRGVDSTVGDQLRFPFAASTLDVLTAAAAVRRLPEVDPARVGVIGYSRGGLAALQAAVEPLASVVLGEGGPLRAVAAAWPWCGYQFERPETAPTAVRFLVGDADDWTSPIQCQAYAAAMQARNDEVSIRVFRDAAHGFGYGREMRDVPDAQKALNAPILYVTRDGRFRDLYSGEPMANADDAVLASLYAPFVTRGATAGSKDGQADAFQRDVIQFFQTWLGR